MPILRQKERDRARLTTFEFDFGRWREYDMSTGFSEYFVSRLSEWGFEKALLYVRAVLRTSAASIFWEYVRLQLREHEEVVKARITNLMDGGCESSEKRASHERPQWGYRAQTADIAFKIGRTLIEQHLVPNDIVELVVRIIIDDPSFCTTVQSWMQKREYRLRDFCSLPTIAREEDRDALRRLVIALSVSEELMS